MDSGVTSAPSGTFRPTALTRACDLLQDSGFRQRFRGGDRGLGGRGVGLRRAEGRGVAGRDPGSKRGPLVGRVASLDAIHSVGLVGERRPARGRAVLWSWRQVARAGRSVLRGSRE